MKKTEVGCAIIHKKGELLIAQRKSGVFLGNYWEFPGGKREKDESFEECLIREVKEELGVTIKPVRFLKKEEYIYPEKTVMLHFYICEWVKGKPERLDCQDFKWVKPAELRNFQFPEGDEEVIEEIIKNKDRIS